MIEISLCMIVKNEEKILARCLDSVADLVDEIVIVDTGSTDATKKIAANYTDKIYDFTWVDDFSAARQTSETRRFLRFYETFALRAFKFCEGKEKFSAFSLNLNGFYDIIDK